MASSLFALIDDIATLLDDVALMTKVAAKKTAGVLGDDLALNAQQVAGVRADRELPVVWAVARGSLRNKAILVPLALAISAWAPWAVTPLLMAGGLFLCFEGVEKLAHAWLQRADEAAHQVAHQTALAEALTDPAVDLVSLEKDKIKGAIRTDFILSAEIITITLGTVSSAPLAQQFAVLAGVAVLMTVGVYGLVAAIVKLDDMGLWLVRTARTAALRAVGAALVSLAPWLMKVLSVLGTLAMFLVGGGILAHGWPAWHHAVQGWLDQASGVAQTVLSPLSDLVLGAVSGAVVLLLVTGWRRLRSAPATAH